MRFKGFIIFFLIPFAGLTQEVFLFQDPRGSFILLNEGWRYQMGDHPDASLQNFDERGWMPVRPASDIHDSLPAGVDKGIGWMRLRLRLAEDAQGKQFVLMIRQSVASEIYLNGKLLSTYGTISADPQKIKAVDPRWEPVQLPFSSDSIQLLAIRFAIQPDIKYLTYYGVTNPIVSAMVMEEKKAAEKYRGIYMRPWLDLFMQGILFMAFVLHMAFFIMYPKQKANLHFSLAMLFTTLAGLLHSFYYYGAMPDQKFQSGVLVSVLYFTGELLLFISIQYYLNIRRKTLIWIIASVSCFNLVIGSLWYKKGFELFMGNNSFLIYLLIIILSIIAWKRKLREARILTFGFSIAILGFFVFLTNAIGKPMDHLLNASFNLYSFFFLLYILAPPAAVSIFLAYDFARTSKDLKQKLEEVATLSEKNLAVEKEKQEILSSQNQKLENMVTERTSALNQSLNELKSTQAQLIQSEKMASLGELTAGIAHEIQNPLNFINNFSEVNTELIGELREELKKGDLNEASLIAENLKDNEEKINHHGKRADGIVKSMLQHSRSSSGQKEMIDVNKLVDEYVRLSFHGYRARQKDFNTRLDFDLDPEAGTVPMVAQDIGRVLLNLLNNAFYAVSTKAAKKNNEGYANANLAASVDEKTKLQKDLYEPIVEIRTSRDGAYLSIKISDNGNGIPERILEKIFQPFFTTKPTGQGTGLGLSLSYDIITKGHGGILQISSQEETGTTATIQLPV